MTSSTEGDPAVLEGIDVWKFEWIRVNGEKALVTDPRYGRELSFNVYTVSEGAKTVTFAGGEFSNGIYGFYLKEA